MNRNIEPCWLLNISWCIIIYNLVAGNYSKSMWWFRDSKPKELCFLRPTAFNTHPETVLTRGTHVCQCIKNQIIMKQSQHELGSSLQFVQGTPRRPWPCKMCIGWVFVLQPAGKLTLQAHMFTVAAIQTISNDDPCLGLLVDFVMHSLMKPWWAVQSRHAKMIKNGSLCPFSSSDTMESRNHWPANHRSQLEKSWRKIAVQVIQPLGSWQLHQEGLKHIHHIFITDFITFSILQFFRSPVSKL